MVDAPDTLAALRRDLGRALSIIDNKAPGYRKARLYGEGRAPEIADSTVAKAIVRQSELSPISFAHIPIDVLADKIELASITAPEAPAARALADWMDAHDVGDEAEDWIRQAIMLGDYYVIVDPQEEDAEGFADVASALPLGTDPTAAVVVYDKRSQRIAEYGAHTWDASTGLVARTRAMLHYDDADVKLISVLGSKGTSAEDFELDLGPDDEPEDAWIFHNGGRMLIHHLAIDGKPYGVPVHRRAWGFQDAITKISANNLVNVDAQGLPSRWALLDPTAEIDDDIDDDFGTDGPTTAAGTGDGMTKATRATGRVRTVPGAISLLRGVKQVGTFDPGTSDPFLKNLDWYVRGMAVACGVALFEFDLDGEQPSGEARRRAEGRSNRHAAKIKRQASAFLVGIADTVLALAGLSGTVAATFNPSETSTDKDGLELVSLKVKAGVPLRQALLEAGYSSELVEEWYPKGSPALSPETLDTIAEVLSKLGTAKTLGAISNAGIEAMLPELFAVIPKLEEGVAPPPTDDAATAVLGAAEDIVTDAAAQLKAKADALGSLIRSGADPEEAAEMVGLGGLTFPNVPVTVRIPEAEASGLEGSGAPAPSVS